MTSDIIQQWVAALRSGKYQQNKTHYLRTLKNEFSPMGVFCDCLNPTLWRHINNYDYYYFDGRCISYPDIFYSTGAEDILDDIFSYHIIYKHKHIYKFKDIANLVEEFLVPLFPKKS